MTSESLKGTMQTNGCVELKRKGQCLKQKECVVGPAFLERRALGKGQATRSNPGIHVKGLDF